jgi:hypothetical protein
MKPVGSIERLHAIWQGHTSLAARRMCLAFAFASWLVAPLLGRLGFDWSRAAAAGAVVVGIVPAVILVLVARRRRRDPHAVMRATLMRTEPELARAALRAMALTAQTSAEPGRGSNELARLHFARLLGRADLGTLSSRARRVAWVASGVALVAACGSFAAVIADPFRVLEGLDVLAARNGRAPVDVTWVDRPRVAAEPPAYLGLRREIMRPYFPTALPVGSALSVTVEPLRAGRALVLTDGQSEVDFVDDGEGHQQARWDVKEDTTLFIAARFGDVLVYEPHSLTVQALPDHAPFVRLEGAPATIRLLDQPTVAIHWEAIDDHGLREVALALRAGDREERRELSKLQGGVAVDRGGIELRADDRFLTQSYLPVEVTVEALDNDAVGGPKWGKSQSIVLLPPQIGEREALRYVALAKARGLLTDLLAARVEAPAPTAATKQAYLAAEEKAQAALTKEIQALLDSDFAGLKISGRLAALARGQLEQMDKALVEMKTGDLQKGRAALIERTESALLALDSGLRFVGYQDSQAAALKLADVADDVAAAVELSRQPAERSRATRRLDADLVVLGEGGHNLVQLGTLGRDLGEIVDNGLRRIRRAWEPGDRLHAKLAAEDLAARLRNPDPSFNAGGGSGNGGVESGGGQPQPGEAKPSEAAEDMADVERDLEQLRAEHQQHMQDVEKILEDAIPPEKRAELEEQMREVAKEVREAVKELPSEATDPDSARAAAAQGRSEAEAMAGAMERGDLSEAVRQGQKALESLQRAAERGESEPMEREVGQAAKQAREKLSQMLGDAEQSLEGMQTQASEEAAEALQQAGGKERQLAERARKIGERNGQGDAPLPGELLKRLAQAAKAMDDAAGELERGKGNEAQKRQREAQNLLEMSQPESERDGKHAEEGDSDDFSRDAEVPEKNRDERADAFRKRVTDGLGKNAPPHLREALRRYTEGLLR